MDTVKILKDGSLFVENDYERLLITHNGYYKYKKQNTNCKKNYIVLSNGCIGYIADICKCDECQKRGEVEIFINGLDNQYLDCIKHHELFDKKIVLNVGRSIEELSQEHDSSQIAKFISDIYQNELFKTD